MTASPPVPEQAIRVNVPGSGPQPQLDEGKHHLSCPSVSVTLKRVLHAAILHAAVLHAAVLHAAQRSILIELKPSGSAFYPANLEI